MRPIVVDAAYCFETGMAGLAVCEREADGGGILQADVIPTRESNDAEVMAAIRAVQILARRDSNIEGGRIYTDSQHVARQVNGGQSRDRAIVELRAMLANHGLVVEIQHRSLVRPAHLTARAVLRAYKAGLIREKTWTRTPYLKPESSTA